MTKKRIHAVNSNILILGLTFKENCPDLRNTRVIDVITELETFNCNIDVYDPWVNKIEAKNEYDITPIAAPQEGAYDAVILAVAHNQFKKLGAKEIKKYGKKNHIIYDIKYILPPSEVDGRL